MNDLEITSKKKKELLKIQKELPPNLKGNSKILQVKETIKD